MNSVVLIAVLLAQFYTCSCGLETSCESVEHTLQRVPQINATGMCAVATPAGAYFFGGKSGGTTLDKPLEFIEGTPISNFYSLSLLFTIHSSVFTGSTHSNFVLYFF